MPVHNGEVHLRESIASILEQSFHDFEFLILNDASTDHTRELILSYDDRRIRLIDNREQLGQTRTLNRGLQLAAGELIARQDADDIAEPDRLARQVAFLESNPQTALIGTWYRKIDDRGANLGTRQLPCDWLAIRWALLFICPFVHSSVMLRKAVAPEKVGFYNETFLYAQDYELWSRISSQFPVANLPEYLVRYRMSSGSMTSTYGDIVQNEIRRTSTANLANLIGRYQADRLVQGDDAFANMSALLFGDFRRLSPQEAVEAWDQIRCLLLAFCHQNKGDRRDFKLQSRDLRSRIARRFVEIGHQRIDENIYPVMRLFLEAYRVHWPLLFASRPLSLGLKLIRERLIGNRNGSLNRSEKTDR
jgi:glycosyltransferase involved in cell wall biosynthesis